MAVAARPWPGHLRFSISLSLLLGFGISFARVNLWQKQWDQSNVYKEFEKRKIREFTEAGYHVGHVTHQKEGAQLGKDDENVAVDPEAMDQLAKKPVVLRLDRSGRAIKEGDKVDGFLPWSLKEGQGLHSAQAPKGWEDFYARYGKMEKGVEGILGPKALNELQSNLAVYEGKDDFRVIRTLSWPGGVDGGGPTSIMLIGMSDMSTRSARLAARAVYEVEPSALMVELCRERIGKQLVMPREHKEAVANYARGFAATNPHRHGPWLHHLDVIQGDAEALNRWTRGQPYGDAIQEFASQPHGSTPRLLCLGDVRSSTMERLQREYGNESMTQESTRSSRARQMALESQEQMMQVHALPGIPDKSPLQLRSSPSPATKDAKMDSDSDVDFVDLESPKRETWSTVTAASLRESASPSGPYFQDKSSPLRLPVPEAFSPPEPASSAASRYLRVPEASPSLRSCTPRSQSTSKRSHASKSSKSNKVVEEEESEDNATFLLMLDVVPAMVIFASSIVAGVSADVDPSNFAWTVCEILFAIFFMGEMVVKIKVFGLKGYFWGDDWYWSWFDLLCVILALIEMTITFVSLAAGKKAEMGAMASLKMLKLARLGRIIRLLKFKIFQELKLMIQGVFTGLRVLFWAVVLLIGCVYLLGVVTRLLFWDKPEFSSVPRAMFTSFRCFTDGCSSYEGAPLQEILFRDWGFGFMLVYILLFLFVTIGIFNLIMAVFIDNVTDGSTKKRQQELGLNAPRTGWILASELRRLIVPKILQEEAKAKEITEMVANIAEAATSEEQHLHERQASKIFQEKVRHLREMYGYQPHTNAEYEEFTEKIREEMASRKVVVTREEFSHWLSSEKKLLEMLTEAEIDLSCKSDLFDVLDADLSGELEFEEMIDGLLKCRGPASKTDIIAIRLKTSWLVRMMAQVCEKLGIDEEA
eukprot:symbB.v1.2.023467.t1/scaffold2148.1/size153101/5